MSETHCPTCYEAPSDHASECPDRRRYVSTNQLKRGDVVRLPGGRVRTVAAVRENGYVNRHNLPLYNVIYEEASAWAGDDWPANSAAGASVWELAR